MTDIERRLLLNWQVAEDKEMSNKSQSAAWKESSSHLPHICPFFYQKFEVFLFATIFGV